MDEVRMVDELSRREEEPGCGPSTGDWGESDTRGDRFKATVSWIGDVADDKGRGLSLGRRRRSLAGWVERSVGATCW